MIIGLCGLKGSGKSTLARWLVDERNFNRVAFADPLKVMLTALLMEQGLSFSEARRMLDGDLKETKSEYFEGKSARHAMQTLGTEWGRGCIDPMFWTNAWIRKAKYLKDVVVDDVRFQTEVDAVRSIGGFVIQIRRDNHIHPDTHISESGILSLRGHKYTIENDKTIEEAHEQIRLIHDIESYQQQPQVT